MHIYMGLRRGEGVDLLVQLNFTAVGSSATARRQRAMTALSIRRGVHIRKELSYQPLIGVDSVGRQLFSAASMQAKAMLDDE